MIPPLSLSLFLFSVLSPLFFSPSFFRERFGDGDGGTSLGVAKVWYLFGILVLLYMWVGE